MQDDDDVIIRSADQMQSPAEGSQGSGRSTSPEMMGCVKRCSLWVSEGGIVGQQPPPPPQPPSRLVVRCPALTHDSPVCFIPCLADGPEISPEQEEGAVPTCFCLIL